jgi:radical SAM superfamily enzyme YgiQ (UPF0313 family)
MNILLTTAAAPKISPFFTTEKRFPLGLGFLISVLRDAGHKVYFLDNYLEPSHFYRTDYLVKNKIDLVGIYANTICYRDTLKMFHALESLRKKDKWHGKIAVGGPHTTVALDTIPDFVDYVIQGEGEQVILDIAEGRVKERVVRAGRIGDLDSLPMPAWDYFINLPYADTIEWVQGSPVFTMNTSRGCPFPCTFCSVGSIWGKNYTFMSAGKIYEDIRHVKEKYGVQGIYFREDNFTLHKERVREFCELLLKNSLDIKWVCETRVDTLNKELISLMHRAGCRGFYLGIESGSQRILDLLKKGITIEQSKNALKWSKEVGIKVYTSFVVGVPTETAEERQQTIDFSKKLNAERTGMNVFVGIPKGELYEYVLENKLYEYIDEVGLVYLKGHDKLVDQFYSGNYRAKIPKGVYLKKIKNRLSRIMK